MGNWKRQAARAMTLAIAASVAAVLALGTSASADGVASLCDSVTLNLVTNCGFETGDFSGWTTTEAASGSLFFVADASLIAVNSGDFAAAFGAFMPPDTDTISQSIATIPGQPYVVSFFLMNDVGD